MNMLFILVRFPVFLIGAVALMFGSILVIGYVAIRGLVQTVALPFAIAGMFLKAAFQNNARILDGFLKEIPKMVHETFVEQFSEYWSVCQGLLNWLLGTRSK